MTDIVERLSDLYYEIADPNRCCLDAIVEIEKLRSENEQLQNCLNRKYEGPELLKQLRHYANFQLDMYRPRHKVLLHNAANEIERLRKENELLRLGWCKEAEKRMTNWANESNVT